MSFFRNKVSWSPVELEYLQANPNTSVEQLSIALAKSFNAIKKKRRELKNPSLNANGEVSPLGRTIRGTRIGKRPDLGLLVRSSWEANILRWLNWKKLFWEYEPKTYAYIEFGVKHGTISYTPDIRVLNWDNKKEEVLIEIKGFLKAEDRTKLNRFRKYYPEEFSKLIGIC